MYAARLEEAVTDSRKTVAGLSIDSTFYRFVEHELLPAIGMVSDDFWHGVAAIVNDLTPVNRRLLEIRDDLQQKIDTWHKERQGTEWNHDEYVQFLRVIGYLKETGKAFTISTRNVDPEIAEVAGPQLVVPVSNARFAINAANARWGSIFDALYGSDVISNDGGKGKYDFIASN